MSSFFSNIFGGAAEREAANANRAAYGNYGTQANGYLTGGLNSSVGALNNANSAASGFLNNNYGLYGDLLNTGNGILDAGKSAGLAALNTAGGLYGDLAKKYGNATTLYQDSLGVNGAAGNTNAVNAFQTGPGYQFQLDQGLQATDRARAARGMLNSGNTTQDEIKFGQGLANQEYGNWQNRLAGFINPELAAAQGQAGVYGNIANLNNQDTLARLGLAQGVTQGQAGVNNAQAANATALGNSLGNLYSQDAQNRVNVAGTVTGGNVSANNLQAQGEAQGSRNLLNAGLGLASLVAGMPGGIPGMGAGTGSTAGSFGNLFGGGGTLFGNGTGYATNPWSSGGAFGGGRI